MECIDSVNADSIDMVDALQSLPLVEGEYSRFIGRVGMKKIQS
jgi:hypothetical protein